MKSKLSIREMLELEDKGFAEEKRGKARQEAIALQRHNKAVEDEAIALFSKKSLKSPKNGLKCSNCGNESVDVKAHNPSREKVFLTIFCRKCVSCKHEENKGEAYFRTYIPLSKALISEQDAFFINNLLAEGKV